MTPAAPDLARIPAGDFLMGAPDADADQRPVHRVRVSEFFIGRFPVTHDQYARFVRATGRRAPAVREAPLVAAGDREPAFRELAARYAWQSDQPPAGFGAHPVVLVTFDDALAYCRWLAEKLNRPFRLPTEAEWERAGRGGVEGQRYPWGDELDPAHCNFLSDPESKAQRGTRPTGTYPPNGFGLYDMIGNVWEWVSDWYGGDYYAAAAETDPQGPESGTQRVVRGGAWVSDSPAMLRTSYRHAVPPDTYAYSIGFRIACSG
jgi:formylglycine-generating enzyme required for sulfatase activity